MIRWYVVPRIKTGVEPNVYFGPKYFDCRAYREGGGTTPLIPSGTLWWGMDYGLEMVILLWADLTPQQHADLIANSDVTAVPANLDLQLGANLATVQAKLEAMSIPANMVQASHTYRQVLRFVISMFEIANSLHGELGWSGRLFPVGVTLATTLGALTSEVRTALKKVAEELGYDYTGLDLASTLRDVLRTIALQAIARERRLNGVVV